MVRFVPELKQSQTNISGNTSAERYSEEEYTQEE